MPNDRLDLVNDFVRQCVTNTARMQGWNPDDWEYAVTFDLERTNTGPITVWKVLISVDSGLIGRPPLARMSAVPGPRPNEQQIAEAIVPTMVALWKRKLAMLGVDPKDKIPTGSPMQPPAGPLVITPG